MSLITILVLICLGAIFQRTRKKEQVKETAKDNYSKETAMFQINAMFGAPQKPLDIVIAANNLEKKDKLPIYKLQKDTQDEGQQVNELAQKLGFITNADETRENVMVFDDGENFMSFDKSNLVLTYNNRYGMPISDTPQENIYEKDIPELVNKVFATYFSATPKTHIESTTYSDQKRMHRIKGYYTIDGEFYGSTYIEGYAFIMDIDENGRFQGLRILLLNSSQYEEVQKIKISHYNELINGNDKYPKKVNFEPKDKAFEEQPAILQASSDLVKANILKINRVNLVKDMSYEYIVPSYHLLGEGTLRNSQGEEFQATVGILITAIDPEYLLPYNTPYTETTEESDNSGVKIVPKALFDPVGGF